MDYIMGNFCLNKFFLLNRSFIFLLFFAISHVLNAQTFELYFQTEFDEVAHDALEEEDGNYLVLSQQGALFTNYPQIILFRISPGGTILNTIRVNINTNYRLQNAQNVFLLSDSLFIITGNGKFVNSNNYSQYICSINRNFEFINDTVVGPYERSDLIFDCIINSNSNILGVGKVFNDNNIDNLIVKEFNYTGELINRKEFDWQSYAFTSVVEYDNLYKIVSMPNISTIFEVDNQTLDILDTIIFAGTFQALKIINNKSNTLSVIAGKKSIWPAEPNEKLCFMTCNNSNELSSEHIYGSPDTNYYYHKDCVDFVSDSVIYLAATHNFTIPPYLYPEPRWIFMNKLKTDGSIIWQRFYKGEVNYMPYKVLATSDGGALILSHKYDWNNPVPDQRDIHILKVDSTGWYDGLVNVGDDGRPLQILVYPNPVRDRVHFESGLYNDLHLQLFDINGKLMAEHPLHDCLTLDMSGYKPGVYVYVISSEKGFLEKGKLVKE